MKAVLINRNPHVRPYLLTIGYCYVVRVNSGPIPTVDCFQGLPKIPKNNPIMHFRLNPRWRLSRSFRFVRLCLLFLWVFLFSSTPNNPSRTWMRFFTSLKLRSTAIISFKTGIPRLLLCQESTFFLSCVYAPCRISLVKNCICCVQHFCCE